MVGHLRKDYPTDVKSLQRETAMQVQTTAQATKFQATFELRQNSAGRMPAGVQMVLHKGEELFAEGDEADFFYQVVSGAIRSYKLLSDGRRQIDAFHLRG